MVFFSVEIRWRTKENLNELIKVFTKRLFFSLCLCEDYFPFSFFQKFVAPWGHISKLGTHNWEYAASPSRRFRLWQYLKPSYAHLKLQRKRVNNMVFTVQKSTLMHDFIFSFKIQHDRYIATTNFFSMFCSTTPMVVMKGFCSISIAANLQVKLNQTTYRLDCSWNKMAVLLKNLKIG